MPPDLSEWFAGIDTAPPPPPENRRDPSMAVFVGEPVSADPLLLDWCEDGREAVAGLVADASGRLTLRCRACRQLQAGSCPVKGGQPDADTAAYCRGFAPRAGLRVGRCWLWRVALADGRLIWWSSTPPASQVEALQVMRRDYGELVQSVLPLPGWQAIPGD